MKLYTNDNGIYLLYRGSTFYAWTTEAECYEEGEDIEIVVGTDAIEPDYQNEHSYLIIEPTAVTVIGL